MRRMMIVGVVIAIITFHLISCQPEKEEDSYFIDAYVTNGVAALSGKNVSIINTNSHSGETIQSA